MKLLAFIKDSYKYCNRIDHSALELFAYLYGIIAVACVILTAMVCFIFGWTPNDIVIRAVIVCVLIALLPCFIYYKHLKG